MITRGTTRHRGPRPLGRGPVCAVVLLLVVLGSALASPSPGEEPAANGVTEYEVKAAFLYRFLSFVEWPAEARVADGEPLIVGVYGPDPFGGALDPELHQAALRGRSIEVRRIKDPGELADCHVVFFGTRDPAETGKLLSRYRAATILTVGESELFLKQGGVIRFYEVDHRVRFEIDEGAARRAGLRISSKLLRLGVRSK